MISELTKDKLTVLIFESRAEMGQTAAADVAALINELLTLRNEVNMIFAAAPSQNEFLAALLTHAIAWDRINAFHMDEYVGLAADAPQGFGNFLRDRIFDRVNFKSLNFLNGNAADIQAECARYEALLVDHPTDIVCMGIGENAHIAFNDPHVADLNDPKTVKVVDLDEACRQQQVNDGCFAALEDVPKFALTLTVPALMRARYAYCVVPGEKKANAVYHTLNDDVGDQVPSTALRRHPNATLYTDRQSAKLIL